MKDYYSILEVVPTAEDVVIRAAYKALAQRYHPDRWKESPAAAQVRMQELNEAYAILSDPEKRKDYDRRLRRVKRTPSVEPRGEQGAAWRNGRFGKDIFGQWLDAFLEARRKGY